MAPKELVSSLVIVTSLLVMVAELPVSSLALPQSDYADASDYDAAVGELTEEELPKLLSLLGLFVDSGDGDLPYENLPEDKLKPKAEDLRLPYNKGVISVLNRLSSMANSPQRSLLKERIRMPLSQKRAYDDNGSRVVLSKKGRDYMAGAMPPMNEWCRMMNVPCY